MTKTNKVKDTTQKTKKMSNTHPERGWTHVFVTGKSYKAPTLLFIVNVVDFVGDRGNKIYMKGKRCIAT
jgi:hypothetical protein